MSRAFEAVIFDMDGVLVDSEPAFFRAVNEALLPTGKQIDWERYQRLLGTTVAVTWRSVFEMLEIDDNSDDYIEQFNAALLPILAEPRAPLPGVRDAIERLRRRGLPVGMATSSRRDWVETLLAAADLPLEAFDAVVWREMAEKGKPAPDLYLRAAELLETPPGRCIAVEDTPAGIASARAAGMYAVHVRASSTAFPPISEAHLVIDTMAAFPWPLLDGDRRRAP